MTTLIEIESGLYRRPSGVPDLTLIVDVEITSANIHRDVVIAITSDAAHTRILVKMIAARCIGDQREEAFCPKIIDPRIWCLGRRDDIFLCCIVKVTKFHSVALPFFRFFMVCRAVHKVRFIINDLGIGCKHYIH